MWLRPVLELLVLLFVASACSPSDRQQVDKLNSLSYAYHYRSLDSTEHYARKALAGTAYRDGQAEALNHLAFVSIARMDYGRAKQLLDSVAVVTDNQLELLVANVQQMRLCQRQSRNREFYDYRERAHQQLRRISEERDRLSERQQQRMVYAESELAIVESTYYYYVGQRRLSVAALAKMPAALETDTAQWLNYLYNVGAGGIVGGQTQEEIDQTEFDHLMRCYLMSLQGGYTYFMANAFEAIAEHLAVPSSREQLVSNNLPSMKFFAEQADTLLSGADLPIFLAREALKMFEQFGDVYQIAGAYRTLATCHRSSGDYPAALDYLQRALADSLINQAPDLVASICEQLSVAYAAVGDKSASDQNRNTYLDLQEETRQDRSLEARADQLEHTLSRLNLLIWGVVGAIFMLMALIWLFNKMYLRRKATAQTDVREQLAVHRRSLERAVQLNVEQRARVSLLLGITPLIDRLLHAIDHARQKQSSDAHFKQDMDYVCELTDTIVEQNNVLTEWIRLQKGELSLRIETFALQPLFDMLLGSKASFAMKGVTLSVLPTTAAVKADRVLTLFMLNTLADNARKFTPDGGTVTVQAKEQDNYVELSVADTGAGMDGQQLAHLFDRTAIVDRENDAHAGMMTQQTSHGFGLLNCKGIIDKYRKMSQIFSPCMIDAESQPGRGSRFFFRLPRGVARLLLPLLLMLTASLQAEERSPLSVAQTFADSAYFNNIRGNFMATLVYADSCRHALNVYYRQQTNGTDTMTLIGDPSVTASEIRWLHDSLPMNYGIIIDMRNETAVAALALKEWELYNYNNRIYTQLFKETSADSSLDDYCRTMQRWRSDKTIAAVLLVLLMLAIPPAYYFFYYRRRHQLDELEQLTEQLHRMEHEENRLHVSNAVLDNCLSTLKHETMYFPSRIRQLVGRGEYSALPEVAHYYRQLYGLLSIQAMRQAEGALLHLEPLDHDLLADRVLTAYLLDILRRQSKGAAVTVDYRPCNEHFVELSVTLPRLKLSDEETVRLFEPQTAHIPFLICKQIVREHGEAIHRSDYGIKAVANGEDGIVVVLKLPRQRHAST